MANGVQKKHIHHFLPHLLAMLGATIVLYLVAVFLSPSPVATLTNPASYPAYATGAPDAGGGGGGATCDVTRIDTNGNGLFDPSESSAFNTCFTSYATLYSGAAGTNPIPNTTHPANACDINHDTWVNSHDSSCVYDFLLASNIPRIISPTTNISSPTSLRGVVNLEVKSNSFTSVNGPAYISFNFRPANITAAYVRQFEINSIRKPGELDTILVPFDTLAMPTGPVEIWVCPGTGATVGCSEHLPYLLTNNGRISEPAALSTISGREVHFSTTFELNGTSSILGPVATVYYQLYDSRLVLLWSQFQQSHDASGRYLTIFDSTTLPNGSYTLRSSFMPYWQTTQYLVQNYYTLPVTITNTTAGIVTNTNTSTPPIVNTNTAINGNTNSSVTNTLGPNSTNTTTSATSQPLIPPTLVVPENGKVYYDLSQITGRVEGGQQVRLTLKIGATTSAADTSGCGFTGGEYVLKDIRVSATTQKTFTSTLSQSLKPGSYSLMIWAQDGTRSSQPMYACFRVQPPRLEMATANNSKLSGSSRLDVWAVGPVKNIEFKVRLGSLPPISVGKGNPGTNNNNQWTVIFDTLQYQAGTYLAYAQGTAFDGTVITSNVKTVMVETANTTAATTPTETQSSPVTITPEPRSDPVSETTAVLTPAPVTTSTVADVDPRTTGKLSPEKLVVHPVANVEQPQDGTSALKLQGSGPPNSVVTIFVYSDPIVVTTRTDAQGNWTYTLDQNLGDGRHQVYVTITDDAGQVTEKSNPLSFFVKEARAVNQDEFFAPTANTRTSDTYRLYFFGMAGLLVLVAIILVVYIRAGQSPKLHRS